MSGDGDPLQAVLGTYRPASPQEADDITTLRAAMGTDVWSRSAPLHVTGSALVLHPGSGQVLLRWHAGLGRWLQVGGHADAGERDPWLVALREAVEETGLDDLVPLGGPGPVQIALVGVPAGKDGPAHRHADVRYLLATARPERATAEDPSSPLRWVPLAEAQREAEEESLRVLLERARLTLEA